MNRTGRASLAKREERTALLMVTPALVIVFLVALYPLASGFLTSFTDSTFASDQPARFVGLRNYVSLLAIRVRVLRPVAVDAQGNIRFPPTSEVFPRVEVVLPSGQRSAYRFSEIGQLSLFGIRFVVGARDPEFVAAVANTLAFTVITVSLETILGTLLALLINRQFRARGMMRALMLLPWAVPTAISSRTWEWMFASTRIGFFNVVFQALGWGDGQVPFLQLPGWQLPAMCIIDVWKTTPFMALLILAGLQLIPTELYEASQADGVGRLRQFWSVTLPLLKTTVAVALVFRTLDALRVFDLFQIVLGQSKYSMASFTYYQLIQSRAAGYSSASGVLIFLVVFAFAVMYTRALGVHAESDLG